MNEILGTLISIYKESGLTPDSNYKEYATKLERLFSEKNNNLNNLKIDVLNNLTLTDIEDNQDFKTSTFNMDPDQKFYFRLGLENFLIVIKNLLKNYTPEFIEFKGLNRQASPPIEAYKYEGHNSLEIKPSKISYSLLFE